MPIQVISILPTLAPGIPVSPSRPGSPVAPLGPDEPGTPRSPCEPWGD